jgi:hypothetical protein
MLKTKRPLIYLSGLLPFFLNQKSYTADQTAEVGLRMPELKVFEFSRHRGRCVFTTIRTYTNLARVWAL